MSKAFGAYDIRGIYPEQVNEELIYRAGRASVIFLKAKEAIVGRDCRTSSLSLKKSLIYGITDQGCSATDIGYCSTPMCYYASQKKHALMITASHNPKEYNGMKIARKGTEPIGENNGLKKIETITNKCHFPEPAKRGTTKQKSILKEYSQHVRKLVNGKYRNLKVLIDCGNGMAGYVVPELLKELPIRYELMYEKMDGTFPNHMPNPVLPKNTAELQKKVKKEKYDLGIAYDGDCDRVFFINEKGKRVRAEHTMLLFAKHIKAKKVAYTVNMSRIAREKVEENKGKALPSRIGHTEIPIVMKKNNCELGGEITGHFYFKKFKYADSGDIAALYMMTILSQTSKTLSELTKEFEKYATSEEINFKAPDKNAAMKKIEKEYRGMIKNKIDGISVDAGDYWFNFRKSNTENLVRLNCEARSRKKLKIAIKKIERIILR